MNWLLLAIITAIFYGMYNFFIKISSGHINQVVGAVILQLVAAILGAITLFVLKLTGTEFNVSSKGVWFAILAGAMVGVAEILSFFVFSKGAPVSVGTAIIIGGSVVVAGIIGLFMKEDLGIINFLGILAIVVGIILFAAK